MIFIWKQQNGCIPRVKQDTLIIYYYEMMWSSATITLKGNGGGFGMLLYKIIQVQHLLHKGINE